MIKIKLKRLLAEKEITQKNLEKMSGVYQPIISAYCKNKTNSISLSTLNKICKALNVKDISEILEYVEDSEYIDNENTTEN